MYTMSLWAVYLLLYMVVVVPVDVSSRPHHTARSRKIQRGVKSFICRLRHRKVVFDFNKQPVGCARHCPHDYQERYTLRWGHHCIPVALPEGCADQYCIQCIPGYKWFYTFPLKSRCIKSCPQGYVTRNGNMCDKCLTDGCLQCANIFTCDKCEGKLFLHTPVIGLVSCLAGCPNNYKKVNVRGALVCVRMDATRGPPTTPTETTRLFTTVAPTTKVVLPRGCKDKYCRNCDEGYVRYSARHGGGSHCLSKCPPGYTDVNSTCIVCADRRCASCKSTLSECETCFPHYAMRLDAFNRSVECVRDCPNKYEKKVMNNITVCVSKPEPECPVLNCKRCVRSNLQQLHSGCSECAGGFKLFRGAFNDHCYTNCPSGYFPAARPGTNITICAKCQIPFCSKCMHAGTCKECVGPMVLDGAGRCTTCPPKNSYNFDNKMCVPHDVNEEGKRKEKNKRKGDVVFGLGSGSS